MDFAPAMRMAAVMAEYSLSLPLEGQRYEATRRGKLKQPVGGFARL